MSEFLVTGIIPVYNSENTILRAVNSLLNGKGVREIILIDDGSTDKSYDLCLELSKMYRNIKLLHHDKRQNRGASESRNLGLKNASFDWIQFLDADDELLPNKLDNQILFNPFEIPFIVGDYYYFNEKQLLKVNNKFSKDIWSLLIMNKLGNTCSNLWSKHFLNLVGGWNSELKSSQEYDLMFRILKINQNIKFDVNPGVIVYKTKDSITFKSSNFFLNVVQRVELRKQIFDYLKENNLLNFKRKYYYSAYVGTSNYNNKGLLTYKFNIIYFIVYKVFKSIKDRIHNYIYVR